MTTEGFQVVDDVVDFVSSCGTVNVLDILCSNRIQFLNVIVNLEQCLKNIGTMKHGGIAEYRYLCLWTVAVSQTYGVVDDAGKLRMGSGFAIAGKGQDVGNLSVVCHLL